MSSSPDTGRRQGDPTGHIGVIDTAAFAETWPRRAVALLLLVMIVVSANRAVLSERLWRTVRDAQAALYADYHPVALQMPNNYTVPKWAHGGVVLMGASNVGIGLPQELSEALFGQRVWTLWAPGINPPEMLALAPQAVRADPRRVILALELQYMCEETDTNFSRLNREAYTGLRNPAWRYRWELSGRDWRTVGRALPLLRLREPLHVLMEAYLTGRVIEHRRPARPAWREGEAAYNKGHVQAALAAWRATPTLDRYQAYQDAVGMNNASMLKFWAEIRRGAVDPTLQSANARALRDLTAYLRARDIPVAWALLPENGMYGTLPGIDGAPVARADVVPAARAAFTRFAAQEGVPYLDLWDLCEPGEFLDMYHVAPPARQKLADALRPLLEEIAEP